MFRKLVCMAAVIAIVLSLLPVAVSAGQFTDYYGRKALAQLPNSEALLYAYDKIAVAAEARDETPVEVYDGAHALTANELDTVMDVYRRDFAHHFWFSGGYSYTYNEDTILSVTLGYLMSAEQTAAARERFEAEVSSILAEITPEMSQFDIELLFHDRIAEKVEYAESANAHNAYGALVEGVSVCEGYAEALQYLLHRAGIESFLAIGSSINVSTGLPEDHEWNYVKIDGKWYQTDATWDDQGDVCHAYFNLSDDLINKDHTATETVYPLPECNSLDAFYYTVRPGFLDSFDVGEVAGLLKSGAMTANVWVSDDPETFIQWYVDNISDIASAAGVTGNFTYGFSVMGNEVTVYIRSDSSVLSGDANGDGRINAKDITAIMKFMLGQTPVKFIEKAADFNGDGSINARDITKIMQKMLNG